MSILLSMYLIFFPAWILRLSFSLFSFFWYFSLQGLSHWRWRRSRKCSISSWRWKVLPAGGELRLFIGTFLNLIFSFSILGRHGACFCTRITCAVGGQILYDRQNKWPQLAPGGSSLPECEYEQIRKRNIKEKEDFLASLDSEWFVIQSYFDSLSDVMV